MKRERSQVKSHCPSPSNDIQDIRSINFQKVDNITIRYNTKTKIVNKLRIVFLSSFMSFEYLHAL